jgi:hypothetical protein
MVKRLEIRTGECGCFSFFPPSPYGHYCHHKKSIYLGNKCTERYIERVLNHESIHWIISQNIGFKMSSEFDNLFYGVNSVASNGTPNKIIDLKKEQIIIR